MSTFKGFNKKNVIYRVLRGVKRMAKNTFMDIRTIPYFYRNNRKPKDTNMPIKVAFLCQYIPAWNKFESIYRLMKESERFEPYIICVPSNITNNKLVEQGNINNDTYDYFLNNGYADVINALHEGNKWFELERFGFDYVFYTRPYNDFMPIEYMSDNVKEYTKICSLIYGMNMTEDILYVTMNTEFYKDVFVYFAETKCAMKMYKRKFPITSLLGWRKVYFYGLPAFEQILKDKEKKCSAWSFSKNTFRVLWTPRWTTAPNLGGTNFFMYYESLIDYATKAFDIDFLVRPHPLAFDNFVKTGVMTQEQVEEYLEKIEKMPNMSLDKEKEYNATIWNSSVLITDISGFMPEYFVTGKPIIYCASNMILTPAEHTELLLKGCYVSYGEEQTYEYLRQLKRGNDPLKEKREEIITELFGENLNNSTKQIVEEIYNLSV